jgi:hypothetical protein
MMRDKGLTSTSHPGESVLRERLVRAAQQIHLVVITTDGVGGPVLRALADSLMTLATRISAPGTREEVS